MSNLNAIEPDQDVTTFDAAFANIPERDDWRAFGVEARETFDSQEVCISAIGLSVKLHNLMDKTKARLGDSYARKDFVKLAELALTTSNVPSGISANQLIPLVWIVKLDKSIPGETGKPRSWVGNVSDPSWYGGNLTMAAIRVLASLIVRVSNKSERDEWDFKPGWEPYARAYVTSLRAGSLSLNGLKKLIGQRENEIQAEADRARQDGLTEDQVAAQQEADAMKAREAKLNKLGTQLLQTYSDAVKELKFDKDQFTRLLHVKDVINPKALGPERPSPADYAAGMTPGDARAMVEAITELASTNPARYGNVLQSLIAATSRAVKEMQSAKAAA